MLRKHRRDVIYVGIDSMYKSYKNQITGYPDLKGAFKILKNKLSGGEKLEIFLGKNNSTYISLRDIKFSTDQRFVTLLWAAGDKEIANPSFINTESYTARTEYAKENELVSISCHLVIFLDGSCNKRRFYGAKENTSIISIQRIQRVLNYFFRTYCRKENEIKNGSGKTEKIIQSYPYIIIEAVPSRTLRSALEGKTVLRLTATMDDKITSDFDENCQQTSERAIIVLKPTVKFHSKNMIQALKKTIGELTARRYDNLFISYKGYTTTGSGTLQYPLSGSQNNDLDSYLFSQKGIIILANEIAQQCEEIHEELSKEMINFILHEAYQRDINIRQ